MSRVLMPIKPQCVKQIFDGTKTFEYRKVKLKRNNVDTIVLYASAPLMKVVGEVELIGFLLI